MKKLISIMLALALCFMCTACFNSTETKSINIYFKSAETNELSVNEIKYSGSQNTVDMANFALSHLISGPDDSDFVKTLPENTNLLSLTVKDSVANVDFSEDFATYTGIDELLARFSVVRTLCDIPGISKVSITVKGMPLISNTTGNEVGVLSKKDIVLGVDVVDDVTTTITMYFATSNGINLKAETRNVKTQNTISIEKTIMTELLKGPSSHELSSVLPAGVKVLNVETKDSVCYVNLSEDFVSKFAGGSGMLTVYSVVNSLCSLESVQSVQILIEGEKGAEFGNFVFDEPIYPNMDIVVK
ncbi:MAG: GerMN domain-containing protein [Clostridia bacterium]|nr:GerMN domain-containing protein [Clostridia bacterium]